MAPSSVKHDVFQAISDPTRRNILKLISDKEMPITSISDQFPISRTAISKHLYVLADAGLVQERKVGRERRFRLNPQPLMELKDWLQYFELFWENKLSALKLYIEQEPTQSPASINNQGTDKVGKTEKKER